mgnify:FL=1
MRCLRILLAVLAAALPLWFARAAQADRCDEVTVEGRAVSRQTGRPLCGAHVQVWYDSCCYAHIPARSDVTAEDGSFRIRFYEGRGVNYVQIFNEEGGDWLHTRKVFIPRSGDRVRFRLDVPEPGVVRGRVLSPEGEPVAGAEVALQTDAALIWRTPCSGETDETGEFWFETVASGEYVLSCGKGDAHTEKGLRVRPGETAEVELTLDVRRRPPLQGRVTLGGKPAAGGRIGFCGLDPDPTDLTSRVGDLYETGQIDDSGSYCIPALPRGRYIVVAALEDGASQGDAGESETVYPDYVNVVTIKDGQRSLDIEAPKTVLEGRIVESPCDMVPNVMVSLAPSEVPVSFMGCMRHAWTDDNGVFRVRGLAPGTHDAYTFHHGTPDPASGEFLGPPYLGFRSGIKVNAGKTAVSWHRKECGVVRGHLRFGNGDPVEGAFLVHFWDENLRRWSLLPRETVSDGSYSPLRLPPGRYTFLAAMPGYSCESAIINVEGETDFSPTLVPAGEVKIRLRGEFEHVAGRIVKAQDQDGRELLRLHEPWIAFGEPGLLPALVMPTDITGRTRIRGLRPGRYTLTVQGSDATANVRVKALEATQAVIPLR